MYPSKFLLLIALMCSAYPAVNRVIHVDGKSSPGGDGTGLKPFNTIAKAIAQAKAASGAAIIEVAPGRYELSSTIEIEGPLELRGSNVTEFDSNGWPTGIVKPGTETRIVGTFALETNALVSIGRKDGSVINDVTIQGLSFEAGPGGGTDVEVRRVQGFTVKDNIVTGPARVGIETVASSGRIVANYITAVGCGACIGAGYPGSPAQVEFVGNRAIRNNNGGVLLNGSSYPLAELGDQLQAVIRNNDLSANSANPQLSFGLRVYVLRRDLGAIGDTQFSGNVHALIQDNRLIGNSIGISIDAGFPF